MKQIEVPIPDGKSGDWEVSTFPVSKNAANMFNLRQMINFTHRDIVPGDYKRLTWKGSTIMSNTPAEVNDHWEFFSKAKGHVLINGLGLGVCIIALLERPEVESITVIEISEDVIKLVAPTFEKYPQVTIIHADAYEWKPPKGMRYDYVWHDIWPAICTDNIEGMKKLHYKYGRRTNWQRSWCRKECEQRRRRDSVWDW